MRRRWFLQLGLVALLTACSGSALNGTTESVSLTVSAAASLQDALKAIAPIYVRENPNIEINYNFASSGALQQQLEQGAPVDVFLSAGPKQMNALEQKDLLLPQTRQNLLKNRMVLVVPLEQTKVSGFKDLTKDTVKKVAIGDPDSVPAGMYGKQVLESLQLYESLSAKFVFAKDVRQVLSYVETENVAAGLVYATDATVSDRVEVIATAPEDTHEPIVYPVAVIRDSIHLEAAKAFVEFLATEEATEIFEQYGFATMATPNDG